MIIETKEERAARGRPIGHPVPYQAMGGLTGFNSLADGYMRFDSSGIGTLPKEILDQPVGGGTHDISITILLMTTHRHYPRYK